MPKAYLYLLAAILAEVAGTSALQASQQFTRTLPSVIVVVGYAAAFYFLSFTLKTIPVGVAYAIWSGLGIVLIGAIGWVLFGQKIDLAGALGMAMIIAGIVVIQLFSSTSQN